MPKHRELGLTDAEYELIVEQLGREPNDVELAMFSLLWSEHCAYKHSRKLLRRLPTEGERVLMGPGENAGAVSVGDGWAVAFKVESHNHPSAVEPFQGAATGVGGILRDVFALGARPIAVLDSLRFGELDSERSRYLFDHVVAGIGHYGNSIGVPTVGGEVYFEAPYEQNCLVNAMCVGLARADEMVRSAAAGVGNAVVLMGASTGRDGIGGASVLASAELEAGDEKRPTVQIGDPFEESKLLECCLELLGAGCWSRSRTSAPPGSPPRPARWPPSGGVGIDIDVARVPLREADMEPFEIMVSESQERMLAVVEPAKVDEVLALCERWETGAAVIGEVTDPARFRVLRDGEVVGEMPVAALVDECPLYDLEPGRARGLDLRRTSRRSRPATPGEILLALLASPEHRQQALGVRAVRLDRRLAHGAPARGRRRRGPAPARGRRRRSRSRSTATAAGSPAIPTRARSRRCSSAPRTSPASAPSRSGSPTASTSATPRSRTSPGSSTARPRASPTPARRSACRSSAATSRSTTRPTTGPIYPTPVVGMVGELPDPERAGGLALARRRRDRARGPFAPSLAGSELAKLRGELGPGLPVAADRRRSRRRSSSSATRCAPGAVARRPRRQRRRPRLRAGRDGDRRRRRRSRPTSTRWSRRAAAPARRRCSARGRAASCRRRARPSSRRLADRGVDLLGSAAPAATGSSISAAEAEVAIAAADAELAWRSLPDRPRRAWRSLCRSSASTSDRARAAVASRRARRVELGFDARPDARARVGGIRRRC